MGDWKLCDSEYRFMCVVWDHAPLPSGELVALCEQILGWKKSTTYTMVKKLAQKGILKNEDAQITVLVPRAAVQAEESTAFVERTFGGSLPAFLAAFLGGRKLKGEEAEALRRLIDDYGEEEK